MFALVDSELAFGSGDVAEGDAFGVEIDEVVDGGV